MNTNQKKTKTAARPKKGANSGRAKWDLRLYVVGQTFRSRTALSNLKLICEAQLKGLYRIEVIDLLKSPGLARKHQILAVPTLVRRLPVPVRNIIGDLSNTESVLVGLELALFDVARKSV